MAESATPRPDGLETVFDVETGIASVVRLGEGSAVDVLEDEALERVPVAARLSEGAVPREEDWGRLPPDEGRPEVDDEASPERSGWRG